MKASVGMAGDLAEIRTEHLPNTSSGEHTASIFRGGLQGRRSLRSTGRGKEFYILNQISCSVQFIAVFSLLSLF
jgi:hypothetical protein